MPDNIMTHLKPVQPEAFDQFMPPEGEELPFHKVLNAGKAVLAAQRRLRQAVWMLMGAPLGFAVAWLAWYAWVALAVVLVGLLVVSILMLQAARTKQVEVQHEADRGIKIVEPREDDEEAA